MNPRRFSFPTITFILATIFLLTSCSLGGCGRDRESSLQVGPEGGEFGLYKGLRLIVPPGALFEELEITVREITADQISPLDPAQSLDDEQLLAAFSVLPDGASFNEPVKIQISGINQGEGDLPLIYNLDNQGRLQGLSRIETEFDPAEGILTLYLEHFSDYAAYLKDDYVSPECQATPCRCEDIKIEQEDSYNICSQDECQVTESEVQITFLECGGLEESMLMREISPSCQPTLALSPDQDQIPPESSTLVQAELGLSCAPFKDQELTFSVDQLGTIDPAQQVSDSAGKAQTTFTAGEDEGTATVTVEASGSYYLLEIIVNGQSSYGEEETYQLSESAPIGIGRIQGNFEAQFNGCNEFICLENYQVSTTFVVEEIDWEDGSWTGKADVHQSGNVTAVEEGFYIEDLTIIQREDIDVAGFADQETGELDLWFLGSVNWPSLNEEYAYFSLSIGESGEEFYMAFPGNIAGFVKDHVGLEELESFQFNIDGSDTPQQGSCYAIINGEDPFLSGSYTLSLEY